MYLGIDFGSSGARACTLAPGGQIEDMVRLDFGTLTPDEAAATWSEVLFSLIAQVPIGLRRRLQALAIDGTAATVLACDEAQRVKNMTAATTRAIKALTARSRIAEKYTWQGITDQYEQLFDQLMNK